MPNFVHLLSSSLELQLPGGHIEADVTTNIGSIPIKAFPLPVNDAPPTKMEVGVPTQEAVNNKGVSKWKLNRKISSIYGDWPEDFIPPEKLPNSMVD